MATRALLLSLTFLAAFFFTTAMFDTYERSSGYYTEGIADSNDVRLGQ